MKEGDRLFGQEIGKEQSPLPINSNTGAYKQSSNAMIEFQLQVDSRITRAVAPLIAKCFSDCGKISTPSFPYADEQDSDLSESWKGSLKEDMSRDRQSLARLLNDTKFKHGFVEVEEENAELVIRAITEIRLFIRKSCLGPFTDCELESGDFSLEEKPSEAQSYYLAYLVLAEVQEGLIAQMI